jgi:hypothetical protein
VADRRRADRARTGPLVDPNYLPIWQATLSAIGLDFSGDLRELL